MIMNGSEKKMTIKFYLVAFNSNGQGHSPIGGLDDVIGFSEFPEDLIDYVDKSSFYFDGHIYFIKENNQYIYADCKDAKWEIFESPIKLEDYHRVMTLG